ncbi:KTSC domain-containing protein [Pantoea sp. App145]|uniref:KTSC domain-containing protein n=1 Tax=Pantoea sp. App145 TaxID=3071567 RepID=UPI003A8104F5
MNRHNISSGLFRSAGFDPASGTLELEFMKGVCRRWLAMSAQIYQRFCSTADPDAFFRHHIDGRYSSLYGESGPLRR